MKQQQLPFTFRETDLIGRKLVGRLADNQIHYARRLPPGPQLSVLTDFNSAARRLAADCLWLLLAVGAFGLILYAPEIINWLKELPHG